MVEHLALPELDSAEVDRIFHALADATRRDIMLRTLESPHSVSSLAAHYEMSFAAVQKHVAVLERAALVVKQRSGREQLVSGRTETLARARDLFDRYELTWRHRAAAMADILAEDAAEHEERGAHA